MTDVTGALLSRQVRREIERKKSKNAVLTVKPDYLKDLCSQAVAKEAAKLAADAKAEAKGDGGQSKGDFSQFGEAWAERPPMEQSSFSDYQKKGEQVPTPKDDECPF